MIYINPVDDAKFLMQQVNATCKHQKFIEEDDESGTKDEGYVSGVVVEFDLSEFIE